MQLMRIRFIRSGAMQVQLSCSAIVALKHRQYRGRDRQLKLKTYVLYL